MLEECLGLEHEEEELKGCGEGDEEMSRLAEETVDKAYIEERVDRLLQDVEAEDPILADPDDHRA